MATRKTTSTTRTTTTRSTKSAATARSTTARTASAAKAPIPTPTPAEAIAPAEETSDQAKAAPETAAVASTETTEETSEGSDRDNLRKSEFVDRVVAETNMKKRDVRAIAQVMFQIMGEALSSGRTIAVDSDFKIRPVKQNAFDGGVVVTSKIRLSDSSSATGEQPLAEPAE